MSDAFDEAEREYERIRKDRADVAAIAKVVGWKEWNVARVKQHLFLDLHWLDRYSPAVPAVFARFDADPAIAAAWRRLRSGNPTASDQQLLRHETAEAWYMRHHGSRSYAAAHDAAFARHPWHPEVLA